MKIWLIHKRENKAPMFCHLTSINNLLDVWRTTISHTTSVPKKTLVRQKKTQLLEFEFCQKKKLLPFYLLSACKTRSFIPSIPFTYLSHLLLFLMIKGIFVIIHLHYFCLGMLGLVSLWDGGSITKPFKYFFTTFYNYVQEFGAWWRA